MSLPEGWTVEKTCARCGKPFEAHRPTTRYCSDQCRTTATREKARENYAKNKDRYNARLRERYATDAEYREEKMRRNREWVRSEKGREYRRVYVRQYYRDHAEEIKARERERYAEANGGEVRAGRVCGFSGPCTQCPFDYCPE